MYSSLNRVDIVATDDAGHRVFMQTDHRQAEEIEAEGAISEIFALARVLNARRLAEDGEEVVVRYAMFAEPPLSFQHVLSAVGAEGEVMCEDFALARSELDPDTILGEAMRRLAEQIAAREGIALGPQLLTQLEERLIEDRPSLMNEEEEISYWTQLVELSAVCGEVMLEELGGQGRWEIAREHYFSTLPFQLVDDQSSIFNVMGKAERFFEEGISERPSNLLGILRERKMCQATSVVMLNLKPQQWLEENAQILQRPLMENLQQIEQEVPGIAYGEDRPETFSYYNEDADKLSELDAIHATALESLRQVEVEIESFEVEGLRVVVVSGDYFASEKLLDAQFMQQMHQRMEAPMLIAGVPRKGFLFLTDAIAAPEQVAMFMQILQFEYENDERASARLCPTPLLVSEGTVTGLVQLQTN